LFLPAKKVTLDITSNSIRLLMVKGTKVQKWASAPIPAGLIEQGVITDAALLGEKIKRLMISTGIKAKKIIASVNGVYSVFRVVALPVQNGHSHEEILNNAAESILPLSPDNFYVTWKMLSPNGRGNRALLVGMQPSVIDPEIAALKSVGLNPHIMNLKGMALLKLVNEPYGLIANIEDDYVDITLLAEGLPYVMRTVSRRHDIAVADWAKDIAVLLEQTAMFASARYHLDFPEFGIKCYLTGQLADNEIIFGIIQDMGPYPIGSLTIPLDCPPNLPVNQYAINLGLAIKENQIPQVVNIPEELLPEELLEVETLTANETNNE
jgi:type IV pilus assembly protein PilM